jgi:peptidoglycan/LPS O-acetylase OafA/YrhL
MLVAALVVLALAASAAALFFDASPDSRSEAAHAAVSPAPLFLIGVAFIALQVWLRPGPGALLRRMMVALAFLLWGVVQLMPPGAQAATLGDVVIALFVVDLAIVIWQETQGDTDEAL